MDNLTQLEISSSRITDILQEIFLNSYITEVSAKVEIHSISCNVLIYISKETEKERERETERKQKERKPFSYSLKRT